MDGTEQILTRIADSLNNEKLYAQGDIHTITEDL